MPANPIIKNNNPPSSYPHCRWIPAAVSSADPGALSGVLALVHERLDALTDHHESLVSRVLTQRGQLAELAKVAAAKDAEVRRLGCFVFFVYGISLAQLFFFKKKKKKRKKNAGDSGVSRA
jgi:hypothetical protein